MHPSTILLSTLAPLALAQTQLPFYWPGFDNDASGAQPDASIITANPSTTVMQLACPTNVDDTECGWGSGEITYSIIDTTVYRADIQTDTLSLSFECTYSAEKTAMGCAAAVQDAEATGTEAGVMSDSTTFTGDEWAFQTATVTAGEEKLGAEGTAEASGTGAPASSFATSVAGGSAGATTGLVPSSSGASATKSATASGTGAPAESTGAAGRFGVEGAVLLMLVGGAVVNVL